jgi:flagella basal body P-ring formation protein FlgA
MMIATLTLAAASAIDCHVVAADVIRMRDLAAVESAFAEVDPDVLVGYSPLPGAVHVLTPAQISRLAKTYSLDERAYRSVCFQRAMRELDQKEVKDLLDRALSIPAARIELLDFSRYPVPVGDLVFPRSGLALRLAPGTEPLLWKGYVVYGSSRHFSVWVRVKINARLNRVIATDNLVTSKPVRADQVRIEMLDGVPDALAPAQSLDEVVGKLLLRPVRSGATVSLDDVSTALTVRRGDKVDVDFFSPGMRLSFVAAAEMDGRYGDHIRLRNLQSNNIFEAEVSGKDQARVVLNDEMDRSGAALRTAGKSCNTGEKEAEGCH